MLNLFKDKICELYNIILSPIDNVFKITALDSYKKENKVVYKKDLGSVYYEFIK